MNRKTTFAAVALAGALVLAGCGGETKTRDGGDGTGTTTDGSTAGSTTGTTEESSGGSAGGGVTSADARALLDRTTAFLVEAQSFHQSVVMSNVVNTGGAESITVDATIEADYIPASSDTGISSMDMTMDMTAAGENTVTRIIIVPEDGGVRLYQNLAGDWYSYPMSAAEAENQGLTGVSPMDGALRDLPESAQVTVRDVPASAETGNVDAHEITAILPPDVLSEIVADSSGSEIDSFEGEGTVVYLSAASDGTPISVSVLVAGVVTSQGQEANLETSNVSSFSRWNEITSIEVPQEAIDAEQDLIQP